MLAAPLYEKVTLRTSFSPASFFDSFHLQPPTSGLSALPLRVSRHMAFSGLTISPESSMSRTTPTE